jgi:hypothetical protein
MYNGSIECYPIKFVNGELVGNMKIYLEIKYEAEIFSSICIENRQGREFLVGDGELEYKSIDFVNNNPFFELIQLFNKRKVPDSLVIKDWIKKNGFLISPGCESYDEFIKESLELVELWQKNEQVQNVMETPTGINRLNEWLIVKDSREDIFMKPEESKSVIEVIEGKWHSPMAYFKESKHDVEQNIRILQYIGIKYIARKISSRIQNLVLGNEKITTVTKGIDEVEEIKLKQPYLETPNLLTAMYLYFYILMQENTRICPVCFGPNKRRLSSKTCSDKCHETYKKRNKVRR